MVSAMIQAPVPPDPLEAQVRAGALPRHVGIIMDGNGRWAEEQGLSRLEGHREGSHSVREITRTARRLGLDALTLFTFSSQNWDRPTEEVAGLMDLLREYLLNERTEILDNAIRLRAVGELDRLPRYVREPLDALVRDSAANSGMELTLAISYGGREELLHAARRLAADVASGVLDPARLSAAELEGALWTAGLPEVDLVIRTSGEQRLSNFLLWQSAYAELVFTPLRWPAFRTHAFLECVAEFQLRERRYGLTSAQVRDTPRALV